MRSSGQIKRKPSDSSSYAKNKADNSAPDKPKTKPTSTGTAKVDPRNSLNELTAKEWIPETVSVWTQKGLGSGHPDAQIEKQHPAPFSFTDVSRLVRFFTKRGDTVLDPFVGIGSTLKACAIEQRKGIGIELNPYFVKLTQERLRTEIQDIFITADSQQVLDGDARDLLPKIASESIDFVVTSPPYWSILKKEDHKVKQERRANGLLANYGDDPRDLAKIVSYEEFLAELTTIFSECERILKPAKYMAIVVSDFRDKSRYVMFHADLAHAMETIGLEVRGLKVLYQRHKKVYPYGYPYAYVPNIHNQYILILQKPKEKK